MEGCAFFTISSHIEILFPGILLCDTFVINVTNEFHSGVSLCLLVPQDGIVVFDGMGTVDLCFTIRVAQKVIRMLMDIFTK